jgi:hypothetical protein
LAGIISDCGRFAIDGVDQSKEASHRSNAMIERAVREFLDSLSPELRQAALFPFGSNERRNWHYIPRERRGVPLKGMDEAQRHAAKAVLRAVLSERGYSRVEDIMWLENVLVEIENDPETYGPLNLSFRLRRSDREGAVGLARRWPSPLPQLRACTRRDHRDTDLLRRQPGHRRARAAGRPARSRK